MENLHLSAVGLAVMVVIIISMILVATIIIVIIICCFIECKEGLGSGCRQLLRSF